MSRGLGRNQRAILRAMEGLHARGLVWMTPAAVIGELPGQQMDARTRSLHLTVQLINARVAAAKGDQKAARLAARLERDGVSTKWKANAFTLPTKTRRRATTPTHKRINPARIFDALEKRGLVDRLARPGPDSCMRLVEGGKSDKSDT